jgi:hypothetical protein
MAIESQMSASAPSGSVTIANAELSVAERARQHEIARYLPTYRSIDFIKRPNWFDLTLVI